MAAQKKKINPYPVDSRTRTCCGGIGTHTRGCKADNLEPVDLDPPAAEIVRWQELTDRDIVIHHDGDAEKVIPFPRPAWAEPGCDIVGARLDNCYYATDWAHVPMVHVSGESDTAEWEQASLRIRAKLGGDGSRIIGLTARYVAKGGEWYSWKSGFGLSPAEALELADVLRAAVDLVGGAE